MFSIWIRAFTRPVPATYEALLQEESNPTLGTAVKWITISAVIAGAITGFLSLIFEIAQGVFADALCGFFAVIPQMITALVTSIILLVIWSAIWLAIARALGGQGNLGSQSYLLAAAWAPMNIITRPLTAIPVVGIMLYILASIYYVYLDVLALSAAHQFGWGKALIVLVPNIVSAAFLICGGAGYLLLIRLAVGETL